MFKVKEFFGEICLGSFIYMKKIKFYLFFWGLICKFK